MRVLKISILKVQNIYPPPCVFFNIFSGINYPAGLEDVAKFSEQNPEIHIRAHLIYGSSAVNVFVGERTPQQTHNVDICFSEFLNYDNNEITGEKEREREREIALHSGK